MLEGAGSLTAGNGKALMRTLRMSATGFSRVSFGEASFMTSSPSPSPSLDNGVELPEGVNFISGDSRDSHLDIGPAVAVLSDFFRCQSFGSKLPRLLAHLLEAQHAL